MGKRGIVWYEAAREPVRDRIKAFVQEQGFKVKGVIPSPITGQDGNVEFLIYEVF